MAGNKKSNFETKFDCKTCAYISYLVSEKYVTFHNYINDNENRNSSVLFFTTLENGNLRNRGFIATRSFFLFSSIACVPNEPLILSFVFECKAAGA